MVIDLQRGFINEHTRHLPPLIEETQEHYSNVIVTRFFNPEESFFRKLLKFDAIGPESEEFSLAFKPKEGALIIDKARYSGVTRSLIQWLAKRKIQEVHVCGVDTDACVLKTAMDLFDCGIRPVVLSKLCASSGGEMLHTWALEILKRNLGVSQIL